MELFSAIFSNNGDVDLLATKGMKPLTSLIHEKGIWSISDVVEYIRTQQLRAVDVQLSVRKRFWITELEYRSALVMIVEKMEATFE